MWKSIIEHIGLEVHTTDSIFYRKLVNNETVIYSKYKINSGITLKQYWLRIKNLTLVLPTLFLLKLKI